jgi:predicted PurR-regulated permease PerM
MVLLLLFCWYFKQIIIVFIGALVLATSLEGLIQISQKIFKNRFISVLVVYVVLLVLIGLLIYAIMPLLINNLIELINDFPTLLQRPEISNIINNFISENITTSQ